MRYLCEGPDGMSPHVQKFSHTPCCIVNVWSHITGIRASTSNSLRFLSTQFYHFRIRRYISEASHQSTCKKNLGEYLSVWGPSRNSKEIMRSALRCYSPPASKRVRQWIKCHYNMHEPWLIWTPASTLLTHCVSMRHAHTSIRLEIKRDRWTKRSKTSYVLEWIES